MKVSRSRRDGALLLRGISPFTAVALAILVALLDDDAAGAHAGEGNPYANADDADAGAEWRRLAGPDLAHLFASARAVVAADLASMVTDAAGERRRLRIPAAHEAAWCSSLSAARLHLAGIHGLDAAVLQAPPRIPPETDADRARLLVDHLGWFQQVLLEA